MLYNLSNLCTCVLEDHFMDAVIVKTMSYNNSIQHLCATNALIQWYSYMYNMSFDLKQTSLPACPRSALCSRSHKDILVLLYVITIPCNKLLEWMIFRGGRLVFATLCSIGGRVWDKLH